MIRVGNRDRKGGAIKGLAAESVEVWTVELLCPPMNGSVAGDLGHPLFFAREMRRCCTLRTEKRVPETVGV